MDDLERQIKINGFKSGLILGCILTVLSITSFYIITAITSPILFVAIPIILLLFIPIFFVVIFCFSARKKVGGYWSFKQATTCAFIMFFTAYMLQFIGKDLVFDKVIRPDNIEMTQNAAINAKASLMKQRGNTQQAIDKSTADLRADFDQQKKQTIGNIIQSVVISVLFVFLFALIFGALFKREAPVYLSSDR